MVVSVQNTQALRSTVDKLKSIEDTPNRLVNPGDLRVQLADILQASLELDTVLKLFLENVSSAVKLDGIHYSNETQGISRSIAKQSSHSCGYRLITSEDKLGEIVFKRSRKFNEKELGILESLLLPLINPLRNALRYSDAVNAVFNDHMTGTGNAQIFKGSLEREIDLSKRHNQSLSLLLMEIDGLKEFKQNFGRDYQDKVITNLATNIELVARKTDTTFRVSDSQFLILLSNTDKNGAHVFFERLVACVHQKGLIGKMSTKKKALGMTSPALHMGLTTLTGTDNSKSLLDRARKALCRSRKAHANEISH
jgi:diguanylate cyclase (GGDEF)-like protein